ncbi:MAG: hypothetical protein PF961_11905 [Planctomycetota bacterium]|jgi:hypothetical protein|nr:hypothetical protein [Planctomycetota bacterium]
MAAVYENRIQDYEQDIASILSRLSHHMHPQVVARIQERNQDEYAHFDRLFAGRVSIGSYLFPGSACVFPGVRRYVGGRGTKGKFNPADAAIIDDNRFPRHLWCFMAGAQAYSGPTWKKLGLAQFELAHVFSHKESELKAEAAAFTVCDVSTLPFSDFTCACNVVLLPKGTVRPTDNSQAIKAIFYQRYIDLYGEGALQGRSQLRPECVPDWYATLEWNEPQLPDQWKARVDKLLAYRTRRITHLMSAGS